MVILIVMSWVTYLRLEKAAPCCPAHRCCRKAARQCGAAQPLSSAGISFSFGTGRTHRTETFLGRGQDGQPQLCLAAPRAPRSRTATE